MHVTKIIKQIVCFFLIGALFIQEISWANPISIENTTSKTNTNTLSVESLFKTQQIDLLALPMLMSNLLKPTKTFLKKLLQQ